MANPGTFGAAVEEATETDTEREALEDPREHWIPTWLAALLVVGLGAGFVVGIATSLWPLIFCLFGMVAIPYIHWKGRTRA